jgi:hypothetical protein
MVEEGFRRAEPSFEQAHLKWLAQMCREQPVAFATTIRSPNSWVASLM